MSDLQPVGVRFVADGATQFLGAMQQGDAAVSQFGQTTQQTGSGMSGFGSLVAGAGQAVLSFGVQALASGVRALQQFGEQSIAAATKYDASMASIVALTSTSAEEVKGLSKEVLNLAGQVGIGPQELADGLYFVASAGFAGRDAMTILTASAKAAAAGLGETKVIADLTTSTLNAYGLSADHATHVTDILVQAVKDGKAEPAEFAGALAKVLPIAAAAGVNFEQVAASISTMTRVGLDANEAATALRGLLSGLEKPSVGAAKALASVGLSADDVRASLREKGLLSTLQDLMQRTNGNVETLGKIIPNVRALTGVLASAGSQAASYKTTLDDMNNASGSTNKAFQVMTQTAAFQQKAFTASMQALQIEVGEKLLPLLGAAAGAGTKLAQMLMDNAGPAIDDVTKIVTTLASVIRSYAIPAISGVTTALIVYATVQAVQALPAILEVLPALALQTEAFFANAAAVTAAVAPYALIAAAVGAVVYAYNDFNSKVSDATTQLLESRQWWQDSSAAIEDYSHSIGQAREQLAPYAATISELRTEIQGEIEDLGRRSAAGLVTEAQYQQEMATINAQRQGLIQVTKAYNDQEQALLKTAAASETGTARLNSLLQGEDAVTEHTQLTEKELEKLQKQLDKTFQDGAKAVESYVNTEVQFMADLAGKQADHNAKMSALEKELQAAKSDDQRKGIQQRIAEEQQSYRDSEMAQAASYAKQQAAQRAHLGQMLSDYTITQVQMGNISNETGQKILGQIESQFGLVQDISGKTFLQMTASIDNAAKNGGAALDNLGKDLGSTTDDAVKTKQSMDALAKKYEAELIQNFNEGKIDAEQLADALKKIPERVYTEVVINHRDVYQSGGSANQDTSGGGGPRASGGPVTFGASYPVGEQGPELFVPDQDGYIVNNRDFTGMLSGGKSPQIDSMLVYAQNVTVQAPTVIIPLAGNTVINQQQTTNMPMQVMTNQSPAVIQQSYFTARALAGV